MNDHQTRATQRLRSRRPFLFSTAILLVGIATFALVSCGGAGQFADLTGEPPVVSSGDYVVLGYNDLGMHCMNADFSELCVLPPANTLRATVIKRGEDPQITTSNVQVAYSIPGNTTSAEKTNFWKYSKLLFGASLPKDMGLFGYGLKGLMSPTASRDFMAQGIPLTPVTDAMRFDPYQLSQIFVTQGSKTVAATQAVVPVSWEMRCDTCHNTPGMTVAMDILKKHDRLEGTNLQNQRPVLCAKCHGDPALGAAGTPGVKTLSSAMHTFHASKFAGQTVEQTCYSCHPGPKTQCFRDIHKTKGLNCNSCHVSMQAVGDPARRPWIDEPRCGSCHHVAGHEYEQPGVLFRDSIGHNGVKCIACHGSPHAITPTNNARDNLQAVSLQGVAGPIGAKCTVCHTRTPSESFNHTRHD